MPGTSADIEYFSVIFIASALPYLERSEFVVMVAAGLTLRAGLV